MNICHVVLFIQDYFVDLSLIRTLQTAEMLKPSSPAFVEEASTGVTEYYPTLVFVHNKGDADDFTQSKLR